MTLLSSWLENKTSTTAQTSCDSQTKLYFMHYKQHNCENQMLMCRHSTWTIANTAWFTLLSCYEEQPSWMLHYWSQCARNVSYKLRVPLSSIQIGYVPFVFSQFVDALNTKVKFTVPCAPPRRDPTQHSYNKTRCALAWRQCVADRRTLRAELVSRRGMWGAVRKF